ncbi:MAG TPA: hypothetical protein VLK33_05380 [Terriglobales bacterium]|nr:hypothetical protein [Terriglobales bacterium]
MIDSLNNDVVGMNRKKFYAALLGVIGSALCLYESIDLIGYKSYGWAICAGWILLLLFFSNRLFKTKPFDLLSKK